MFRKIALSLMIAGLGLIGTAPAYAGPTETANKQLVANFYAALEANLHAGNPISGVKEIAEKFLAPDYKQHSVMATMTGHGRQDFIDEMANAASAPPPPAGSAPPAMPSPPTELALMADGDTVILVTQRKMALPGSSDAKETIVFNMFRVQNGMLAEHWDAFGVPVDARP